MAEGGIQEILNESKRHQEEYVICRVLGATTEFAHIATEQESVEFRLSPHELVTP